MEEISFMSCTGDCATCQNREKDSDKPSNKQVGGNHYQGFKIQPKEFFLANNLPFFESSVIKYVCRHKKKDGKKDLLKAIHCCEILIEEYYG
jgi:hypothetical protein